MRALVPLVLLGACVGSQPTPAAPVVPSLAPVVPVAEAQNGGPDARNVVTDGTAPPLVIAAPPPALIYTRCSVGQLNTPCSFRRGANCFLRRNNCTDKPCTESAPEPIDCARYDAAPEADGCDIYIACVGMPTEGCVVERCGNPMAMCLPKGCARSIVSAASCREVRELTSKPGACR